MSLLTDVRFALKKYINSEIACNILSYETYKQYCEIIDEEPSSERFEEISKSENATLLFDKKNKEGFLRLNNKFYRSEDVSGLKEMMNK